MEGGRAPPTDRIGEGPTKDEEQQPRQRPQGPTHQQPRQKSIRTRPSAGRGRPSECWPAVSRRTGPRCTHVSTCSGTHRCCVSLHSMCACHSPEQRAAEHHRAARLKPLACPGCSSSSPCARDTRPADWLPPTKKKKRVRRRNALPALRTRHLSCPQAGGQASAAQRPGPSLSAGSEAPVALKKGGGGKGRGVGQGSRAGEKGRGMEKAASGSGKRARKRQRCVKDRERARERGPAESC